MATDFIKRGAIWNFFGSRILMFLMGINIVIAIIAGLTLLFAGSRGLSYMESLLALPASFNDFLHKPWSLLTYMVTQFSLLHLLFNMIWLFWFGKIISSERGDTTLLACYAGGGIFAGLCYLGTAAISGAPPGSTLCGASGAVLAVMTAVATLLPSLSVRLFLIGNINIKWLAVACVVLSFIGAGETNIDSAAAHAGGAIFGLIFALSIKRTKISPAISFFGLKAKAAKNIKKFASTGREKDADAAVGAMTGRLCDTERLDTLLDKIRQSGYASLSERERKELNAISNRL